MSGRKAVIIGSGLGGLGAALRLAARGWDVTICEQADAPGGKMNRWQVAGYTFDTGPSLITMPWIFEDLFKAAGSDLRDHLKLIRVHPIADYSFDDGVRFTHTTFLPEWLDTVRRLEGGDASGFFGFMALGAKLLEVSKRTFFARAPFERPDPSSLQALRHMPLRHGFSNYHRVVCRYFKSDHLRRLYDRYMTYVGSSPYLSPSTLSVIPYIEYAFGGWHVEGGLYRMVEALLSLAQKAGVRVLTRARAIRIDCGAGRVRGVELEDARRLPADVVVMNGDASCAPRLLGRPDAAPLPDRDRSLSGLIFLFALKKPLPGRCHHNVCFSSDYPREFQELFDERRFPTDPTVYVNVPTKTDTSMAPPGGEVLFVMANAPASDAHPWDEAQIRDARARVFARLKKAGFPDFESDVVAEDVWTPRRIGSTYDMPGGAIYGTNSHGMRRAFLRPRNKDSSTAGLYYVGGSTHPGGGTPTVLMSSSITANLILTHEGA
jgi:phytoene desaturase